MSGEELLRVEGLKRSFQTESGEQTILKGITVSINKGDFVAIMGASGSGKSTFLYCISGMDRPSEGRIMFHDTDMTKLSIDELASFRKEHCGFVFQQICLVDTLSVMDNIMVAGLLSGTDRKELYERAQGLLKHMDVEEHTWTKFPNQISGGKAQRVGIVRAMINQPEILFADEPTGALNSQVGQEVLDAISDFNARGQTTIMVTHDLRSALRANRVLYLKDGLILDECKLGTYHGESKERTQQLTSFLTEIGW